MKWRTLKKFFESCDSIGYIHKSIENFLEMVEGHVTLFVWTILKTIEKLIS